MLIQHYQVYTKPGGFRTLSRSDKCHELIVHLWIFTNFLWEVNHGFHLKFCHNIDYFSRHNSLGSLCILILQSHMLYAQEKLKQYFVSPVYAQSLYSNTMVNLNSPKHVNGVEDVFFFFYKYSQIVMHHTTDKMTFRLCYSKVPTSISQIHTRHCVSICFILFYFVVCLKKQRQYAIYGKVLTIARLHI